MHDVYHDQEILRDGVVPRRLIVLARHFRREVVGVDVPDDRYVHVVGSDLVRGADGRWLVLEDNLRVPARRLLRARQPADDDPRLPGLVRGPRRAAGRLLLPASC